ncbi:LADA_0E02938g1_1 [Lachancea dasiensis]|uniref:LADA_0E02938g1_1 n=1 Tax=Lachancea dasiensis TaxID=1072105 RepID=A0A1G4JB49_9SACH|nr:LADA_0E02938g1_1 [Lachancea dasiensis]
MQQDDNTECQNSPNGQVWVYDENVVEWKRGAETLRRFEFPGEKVFKAGFVDFETVSNCLVIILEDRAQIYYVTRGDSNTVSFPFCICKAFIHPSGVILERRVLEDSSPPNFSRASTPLLRHRFITLTDPLNLFGSLVIASCAQEQENKLAMLHFPSSSDHHIGVLYDSTTQNLSFHNVKILSALKRSNPNSRQDPTTIPKQHRKKTYTPYVGDPVAGPSRSFSDKHNVPLNRRALSIDHNGSISSSTSGPLYNGSNSANSLSTELTSNLRKISIMNRRSVSGTVGVDGDQPQLVQLPTTNMHQLNAENIKRSTSATLDRMGSGSILDISPSHTSQISQELFDHTVLNKDVLLTKIAHASTPKKLSSRIRILNCRFEDKEALILHDTENQWGKVWIFDLNLSLTENMRYKALNNSPIALTRIIDIKWSMVSSFCSFDSEILFGFIMLLSSSKEEVTLYNPFLNLTSNPIQLTPDIHHDSLYYARDNRLLTRQNSAWLPLTIVPELSSVKHCFQAIRLLCDSFTYSYIALLWQVARNNLCRPAIESADFLALKFTLVGLIQLRDLPAEANVTINAVRQCPVFSNSLDGARFLPKIVMGLHLIREEYQLNLLQRLQVQLLGELLCLLTKLMHWPNLWQEFYGGNDPSDESYPVSDQKFAHPLDQPPSIIRSLYSATDGSTIPVTPFITFSRLLDDGSTVDHIVTPRTHKMLQLFEGFDSTAYSHSDLLAIINSLHIDQGELETYPLGIYAPLKGILKSIEKQMSDSNTELDFSLIERSDLRLNAQNLSSIQSDNIHGKKATLVSRIITGDGTSQRYICKKASIKSIKMMVEEVINLTTDKGDDQLSIKNNPEEIGDGQALKRNASLIFSQDRRFFDAVEFLHYGIPHKINLHILEKTYTRNLQKKRIYSQISALRTFTSAIGWGAVAFATERPLATQKWPRSRLNLHCTFPDKTTVSVDPSTCDPNLLSWGEFHGGVSSGLRISPKSAGITGSWITFAKPPELDAQHGGLLLGLGLNGHLKNLEEWHVYNYLSPKQTHTSIGLMLGMSASLKGTMDLKLTKVLSVHIVALLPQGSSDLNVNFRVQTAGLIGIGLLYLNSQHRRMTDMLFSQLTSFVTINEEAAPDEGYRMAAGVALGLINLGTGSMSSLSQSEDPLEDLVSNESDTENDRGSDLHFRANGGVLDPTVSTGLLNLVSGAHDTEESWMSANSQIGTVVALMLIYLKTNNQAVAGRLAPGTGEMNMKLRPYMRPEMFMYREWARHMILWDGIEGRLSWLFDDLDLTHSLTLDTDSLPQYYCLAGRTLAVGLKFASSGDKALRDDLLYMIDKLLPLYQCSVDMRLDFQLAIKAINILINVLLVSVSMVMSGTGDLAALRRIRFLHETITGRHSDLFRAAENKKGGARARGAGFAQTDDNDEVGSGAPSNFTEAHAANPGVGGEEEEENEDDEDEDDEDEDQGNFSTMDTNTGSNGGEGQHWKDEENHFGKYMATSMSLGFLFLGSGQYAFKTSSLDCLAYLIISVLPTYMNPHCLQETRHFWSMAVAYRSLIVRDSKTGASLNKVPVEILMKPRKGDVNPKIMNLFSPCLLPDVRNINSIRVLSPDYYPVSLTFKDEQDSSNFLNNGCVLFVQPKDESIEGWEVAENTTDKNLEVKYAFGKSQSKTFPHSPNGSLSNRNLVQLFTDLGITRQEALDFGSEISKLEKDHRPLPDENLLMSCQNKSRRYQLELWRCSHNL